MGVSKRLVLFSEVRGTVLMHGSAVQGAQIRQEVVWSDNKDEIPPQQAVSDVQGAFSFPAIERNAGVLRLVPHQPVILQKILIQYQGVEYTAWRHTKDSYEENSELGGRPLKLVCDLASKPDFEGTGYGICKGLPDLSRRAGTLVG